MYDGFENFVVTDGTYASRYIASWTNVGGKFDYIGRRQFIDWCKSIGVSDEEARRMANLATNGKLELQVYAKRFMEEKPYDEYVKKFLRNEI